MLGSTTTRIAKHERTEQSNLLPTQKVQQSNLTVSWKQKVVIEYWFRMMMKDVTISISDIISIILKYSQPFELLQFNKEWMSIEDDKPAFALSHNDTMATKVVRNCQCWILADIEPVKEGKVCWRINVEQYNLYIYIIPCF